MGYEHPVFACLEADCSSSSAIAGKPEKNLVLYQLDLGLNHVIRNYCEAVDISAHKLLPVPAQDGPAGVIVVCENYLIYKKVDHDDLECPIPRRNDMDQGHKLFSISYSLHRQKNFFFFILQSELGDLYKITLNYTDEQVHSME